VARQFVRESVKLILIPTDFSPGAEPALNWARTLAELTGAKTILLHVFDFVTPALAGAMAEAGAWVDDKVIQQARDEANAAMARLAPALPGAKTLVRDGVPRSVILEVAEEVHADIIVMGTHGLSGLAQVLLGSVADHVVRSSRIPVLTVRQKESTETAGSGS
jgi:nucleotide-binding universal stress UspA family protein